MLHLSPSMFCHMQGESNVLKVLRCGISPHHSILPLETSRNVRNRYKAQCTGKVKPRFLPA